MEASKNVIPKRIHYCWFGGNELSELSKNCIASWKKYCPDYEIIEWNESNFDININDYVKEAYKEKKWAFVSDVARVYALVNYGGIYMDTDVEVLRPLDDLLGDEGFSGFESPKEITTGILGSKAGSPIFQELLEEYKELHYIKEDGSYDITANVVRLTNICLKYGLVFNNEKQCVNGFMIYPRDYLCPKDYRTRKLNVTPNTYVIHHFDGSWLNEEQRAELALFIKLNRFLPKTVANLITGFVILTRFHGLKTTFRQMGIWFKRDILKKGGN